MEPHSETISVRIDRINSKILGNNSDKTLGANIISREGLLDALQILYDECDADHLKKADKNIQRFIVRYRDIIHNLKHLRVNITDFEIKDVIGRGHFGEVHVVREKQTGDIYAMKTIKKCDGASSGQKRTSFEEERNIMVLSRSPWLTTLQYAFQDDSCLFYVMEYHPGGDLVGLLYRQGGSIPESAASFYVAELVMALLHLHQMGFVHRDVKPDNILLDRCGHIKLADFGSAAKLDDQGVVKDNLPVGTPDYIAPEVLQSLDCKSQSKPSYGIACDYWSVGILAYELTVGNTPFNGHSTASIYSKIMKHKEYLKFPPGVLLSQAYISLIKGLITDEKNRLNHDGILQLDLFKNIDFSGLRDLVPPFVPKISCPEDTSNFSDVPPKKNEPNLVDYRRRTQFSGRNLPFVGFTYTHERENSGGKFETTVVKDETLQNMKDELNRLKRKLIKSEAVAEGAESLEKKLEEKCRKLESIEAIREKLERDLAKSMSECLVLKRTIEMERKDRIEVEKKALEMIKSAKQKWDSSEKAKISTLTLEVEEYKEKVKQLSSTNQILKEQLQSALQLETKQKMAVENMENLSRRSVIGLESRLEKVTVETQSQLSDLRLKLTQEIHVRKSLEKEVENYRRIESELVNQVKVTEENFSQQKEQYKDALETIKTLEEQVSCLLMENKNLNKLKIELDELRSNKESNDALVSELTQRVEQGKREVSMLSQEVENLKEKLQKVSITKVNLDVLEVQKTSVEKQLKEEKASRGKALEELREEVIRVKQERDDLQLEVERARLREEANKSKLKTLEELLMRLESGVAKLEKGSGQDLVLQETVERLEQQLLQIHEQSAVEKQEHNQLKTKFWRLEKELENANIDKRILERELKEMEKTNKQLEAEIEEQKLKAAETKRLHESAIMELSNLNENLSMDIVKLRDNVRCLEEKLKSEREKCDEEKIKLKFAQQQVKEKESQLEKAERMVDDASREKEKLIERLKRCENDVVYLQHCLEEAKKEKLLVESKLESSKKDMENTQLNLKALREACVLLENQVVQYELVTENLEKKQSNFKQNTEKLVSDLNKSICDLQEARRMMNEEKSLRLLAETKVRRLHEDIECLQKECDGYKKSCDDARSYANDLSNELSVAEERVADMEVSVKALERQVKDLMKENKALKEECSGHLTHLMNVKETNYRLNKGLEEAKERGQELDGRVRELERMLSEKERYYGDREVKAEATMQQQTKLIDYLQSKVEEYANKKKSFTERLFSHSKKENQPPQLAVNKDLEQQLQKERRTNKTLRDEIFRLKCEKQGEKEEEEDEVKQAVDNLVRSPSSGHLKRQNSLKRMHHNIPHRFEVKICARSSKCFECNQSLAIGRSIQTCKECGITVHSSCAKNAPHCCGLPKALVRHFSESVKRSKEQEIAQVEVGKCNEVCLESWVKIPSKNKTWQKCYARLTPDTLTIYEQKPEENQGNVKTLLTLDLKPENSYGKVVLEPVESEIGVPVAYSDLPFVLKVEITQDSTRWPPKHAVLMLLSVPEKEKWYKALQSIFKSTTDECGTTIITVNENLDVNCAHQITNNALLLGTEDGLYTYHDELLVHIASPLQIYSITIIPSIKTALMIADTRRVLISCDLNHLKLLAESQAFTKPTLKFIEIDINKLSGFHLIEAGDFVNQRKICVATLKQVIIMKYELEHMKFVPLRVLDTAQPTSCAIFGAQTLIVGADKYFEIDLKTFRAEEFLDEGDEKLQQAARCYKLKSYPLAILKVASDPLEYLICFKEFAVFVDEYGSSTRTRSLLWRWSPLAFHFVAPFLYVVQVDSLEIIKITDDTCNSSEDTAESSVGDSWRFRLNGAKLLGRNDRGILLGVDGEVRFVDARKTVAGDDVSVSSTSGNDGDVDSSERFSFTSSIVQSLDGLSDADSGMADYGEVNGRKKVVFTDL